MTRLLHTFPDCTRKTLESLRKKKLEHWLANSETNRSWLSLNMATEAAAGFPAFHYGERGEREIDFVALRRAVAEGARFDPELVARGAVRRAPGKRWTPRSGNPRCRPGGGAMTTATTYETLRAAQLVEGGTLLEIVLDQPKGNVADLAAMMAEISTALGAHDAERPTLRMVLLRGAGGHFSYGASIEEHRKEHAPALLAAFHRLIRQLAAYPVPVAALVEGQCLGGGFELDPRLPLPLRHARRPDSAVPEIKLGVFPPVLAAIGARQLGGLAAERLLLTGALDRRLGGVAPRVPDPGVGERRAPGRAPRLVPPDARPALRLRPAPGHAGAARDDRLPRRSRPGARGRPRAQYVDEILPEPRRQRRGRGVPRPPQAPQWRNR